MMQGRAKDILLVASLGTCVFLAGRLTAPDLSAEPVLPRPAAKASLEPSFAPQGRTTKRGIGLTEGVPLIVDSGSGSTSSSTNGFLAVTGSYGVGTSVLYLIDTAKRQLACYEARGGSQNSRRLTLVGARRIDLDLQLEGYNDESEWSYSDLLQKFERATGKAATPATTDPASGDGKK